MVDKKAIVCCYDLRGDSQCREQHYIYLWVSQKPEKVLIENRRSALVVKYFSLNENIRQEKGGSKTTVHNQKERC